MGVDLPWKLVEGETEKYVLLALYESDLPSYGEIARTVNKKFGIKISKMSAHNIFKKYEKLGIMKRKENGFYSLDKNKVKIKLFSIELLKDSIFPALIGFVITLILSTIFYENSFWIVLSGLIVFLMQFLRFLQRVFTTTETRLVFVSPNPPLATESSKEPLQVA